MVCKRLAMVATAYVLCAPHGAIACITSNVGPTTTVIAKRGNTYFATTTYSGIRSSNPKCGWQDLNSAVRKITQINAFGFVLKNNEYSLGNFSSTGTCIFKPTISAPSPLGPLINLDVDVVSSNCIVKFEVIRWFTGTYDGTGNVNNPLNNVVYRPDWRIINTSSRGPIGSVSPIIGINVPSEPTRTCSFTAPSAISMDAVKPSEFAGQNRLVGGTTFTTQIQCPPVTTPFTPKVILTYTEATDAGLTSCTASNIASANGAAQGVGFRLINVDNLNIPICGSAGVSTIANVVSFPTSSAGVAYQVSRTIGVKYVQTGTTVTPGAVTATVTFTTIYQ
jgi:type 1 fimbria pilin